MYACIRKIEIVKDKIYKPVVLDYISPRKLDDYTNIPLPWFYDHDTYIALGNVYKHHWWYKHNINYRTLDNYVLRFTNTYTSAFDILMELATRYKKASTKNSNFMIYQIGRNKTDILQLGHTEFHIGAKQFIKELESTKTVTEENDITLKYADYHISSFKFDGKKLILIPEYTGYVFNDSDIFHEPHAGYNWCKWYKRKFMNDN